MDNASSSDEFAHRPNVGNRALPTQPSSGGASGVDVFVFQNPAQFLAAVLAAKRSINPRFSLRAWARQMGLTSPSHLSRILSGKRKISNRTSALMADVLGLDPERKAYFVALVQLDNCYDQYEFEILRTKLRRLKNKSQKALNEAEFRPLSDWYTIAILEMIALSDFHGDGVWISRRLGDQVTPAQAEASLEALLRSGLVFKNEKGSFERTPDDVIVDHGVSSEAVREFHRKMMILAMDALEAQSLDQRQMLSTTLSLPKAVLIEAQEILNRAHAEILKLSCREGADHTIQVNSQLFQLATAPAPRA